MDGYATFETVGLDKSEIPASAVPIARARRMATAATGIGIAVTLLVAVLLAGCGGGQLAGGQSARGRGSAGLQTLSDPSPAIADSVNEGPVAASEQKRVTVVVKTPSDVQGVTSALGARGLLVQAPPQGLPVVDAQGTVGSLESAFGVKLYRWKDRQTGEQFDANDQPIAPPPPLAQEITGVLGLDNSARSHTAAVGEAAGTQTGNEALRADQIRSAYNVQSLLDSGVDGSTQTVAIFAYGGFNMGDITAFDSDSEENPPGDPKADLSQWPLNVNIYTLTDPGDIRSEWASTTNGLSPAPTSAVGDAEDEAELDIEAVHAMAPGATIDVLEIPPENDAKYGFVYSLSQFLEGTDETGANVASISLATCESAISRSDLLGDLQGDLPDGGGIDSLFQFETQSASKTILAASGDSGKWCDQKRSVIGVDYPASDPWVTSVGGTSLQLNSDGTLNAEQGWDEGRTGASGGGESSVFSRPTWQSGDGVDTSQSHRMVPDVAADADLATGMDAITRNQQHRVVGGTSLSAPLWAGLAALYDQEANQQGTSALGLANPALYKLAQGDDRALFDVTAAQATTADLAGSPKTGWDFATGLGTPNAYEILHDGLDFSASGPISVSPPPPGSVPPSSPPPSPPATTAPPTSSPTPPSPSPTPPASSPAPATPTPPAQTAQPGHESPAAAVTGVVDALNADNTALACSYTDPSEQSTCNGAYGLFGGKSNSTATNFALGTVQVQGNQAIVVMTGTFCDSSTNQCATNSDPNAGLDPNATFTNNYSNALNSTNDPATGEFAVPCALVQGNWYVEFEL